jgi:hypothetical protein
MRTVHCCSGSNVFYVDSITVYLLLAPLLPGLMVLVLDTPTPSIFRSRQVKQEHLDGSACSGTGGLSKVHAAQAPRHLLL